MKNAKMKAVRFDGSDVIATSSYLTISNSFDGQNGNATFNVSGTVYSSATISKTIIEKEFGSTAWTAYFYGTNGNSLGGKTLKSIVSSDKEGGDYVSSGNKTSKMYNNTYVFKNGGFHVKQ